MIVFKAGAMGVVIVIGVFVKHPGGSNSNQGGWSVS
jgi:hypothetical protein